MNTTIITNTDIPVVVPAATKETLNRLCGSEHSDCFVCRPVARGGLGLEYLVKEDGSVFTVWISTAQWQSYEGTVHGGILATLLDSAMVHALFARGIVARTGELVVRYRRKVSTGIPLFVTAKLVSCYPPLFHLEAEINQGGLLCAQARAKFMKTTVEE